MVVSIKITSDVNERRQKKLRRVFASQFEKSKVGITFLLKGAEKNV